jgi:hypothetical protein
MRSIKVLASGWILLAATWGYQVFDQMRGRGEEDLGGGLISVAVIVAFSIVGWLIAFGGTVVGAVSVARSPATRSKGLLAALGASGLGLSVLGYLLLRMMIT